MITYLIIIIVFYLMIGALVWILSNGKYVPIIWWWLPMGILVLLLKLDLIPFGCTVNNELQVA